MERGWEARLYSAKELYRGSSYSAGEFGGMIVHPEDRKEGEPFSGCYEKYASVTALVQRLSKVEPSVNSGKKRLHS